MNVCRQTRRINAAAAARALVLVSALGLAAGCGGAEPSVPTPGSGKAENETALAAQLAEVLEQQAAQDIDFEVLGCRVDGSGLDTVAQLLGDGTLTVSKESLAGVAGYAADQDTLFWPPGSVSDGNAQNVVHEAVHALQDNNVLSVTYAQSEVPAFLAQLLYEVGRMAGQDPASRQQYVTDLQSVYASPSTSFESIVAAALSVIQNSQDLLELEPVVLLDSEVEDLLTVISESPDFQAHANEWVPTDGITGP